MRLGVSTKERNVVDSIWNTTKSRVCRREDRTDGVTFFTHSQGRYFTSFLLNFSCWNDSRLVSSKNNVCISLLTSIRPSIHPAHPPIHSEVHPSIRRETIPVPFSCATGGEMDCVLHIMPALSIPDLSRTEMSYFPVLAIRFGGKRKIEIRRSS